MGNVGWSDVGEYITVVLRNDAPAVHLGATPSYRTVRIKLTDEQRAALRLRETHGLGEAKFYEEVSQLILEED